MRTCDLIQLAMEFFLVASWSSPGISERPPREVRTMTSVFSEMDKVKFWDRERPMQIVWNFRRTFMVFCISKEDIMGDHTPNFLSDNVTDNWINSTIISANDEEDKFVKAEKHASARKSYLPAFAEEESMFSESGDFQKLDLSLKEVGDEQKQAESSNKLDDDEWTDPGHNETSSVDLVPVAMDSDTELTGRAGIASSDFKVGEVTIKRKTQIFDDGRKQITIIKSTVMPDGSIQEVTEVEKEDSPGAESSSRKCPPNASPGGKYFAQIYKSGCCSTTRRVVYAEPITGRLFLSHGEEVERHGKLLPLNPEEEECLR